MKLLFITIFTLIFITCSHDSVGQKVKKKFKKSSVVQFQDSLITYSQSDIFDFPNVNNVRFYLDSKKIKGLQQAEKEGNTEVFYQSLKDYVRYFGIENFSKNTSMIWQLAKLSKQYGPPGESVLLYKLALKHHQQGIDISNLFAQYDSLERDRKKYYVPLNYYYELVDYRKEIDTLQPPHGILVNMGEGINSPKEDYGPVVGNVDYVMLFTSKRNAHNERTYDEDLFFSLKIDGAWTATQEFNSINTQYNEGSACLSMDGKKLFFSRCNAPGSIGNCDLYVASLSKDSIWSDIKNLGSNVNSSAWDSQPSISHGGDTLFFASNRIGGFGLTDIYFTVKDNKGVWQPAKNIGPIINTRNSEVSPFFHHVFNVLYFSSNGHPLNFGEFDIYKSYRTNTGWKEPKNIGPLVNGAGSEYYFTIDSRSHDLYYARSVEDDLKNLDLYSFPVPMEAQPEAVAQLKGTVTHGSTSKPEKGIVSVIDLDKGVEVAPRFLREDGSFDFSLINKRNYLLIIQGDDFFRVEEIFFMNGDTEINKAVEPIESKIEFASLEFENGKADILTDMHKDLDKLANFLTDHPDVKLKISGHTDSQGREETNLRLSQARADAIKNYLANDFKINPTRITAIGYGSAQPIAREVTDEHKQLNRRVEFEITRE